MQTIINNDQRIFLLTGDMGKHVICNIEEFKRAFNSFDDKDEVKIQHLWNQRFVSCSRKSVIDMSEAMNLAHPFNKFYLITLSFTGKLKTSVGKVVRIKEIFRVDDPKNYSTIYEKYDLVTDIKIISIK